MWCEKRRGKRMTAKERDKKAIRLLAASFGAYILVYLYLIFCYKINVREDVTAWGFVILTLVGALCAYAYGKLPKPEISPECLEELEKMIESMKEDV